MNKNTSELYKILMIMKQSIISVKKQQNIINYSKGDIRKMITKVWNESKTNMVVQLQLKTIKTLTHMIMNQ